MPVTPRSRYAAVVTTAVVGAGVVALGAGAGFHDAKLDSDRLSALGSLDGTLDERAEAAERASRAERSTDGLATSIAEAPDAWLLPVVNYSYSSPYGERWGRLHAGVDLAVPLGTPVSAMNAGTVVMSRWYSGYGYAVMIDHGDGVVTLYGHNSELIVSEGEQVQAGDRIALAGNTGYSFGPHVHLEVHINGEAIDPVPWLSERGVDIPDGTDPLYAR